MKALASHKAFPLAALTTALLLAVGAWAAGPGNNRPAGRAGSGTPNVDPAAAVVLEGPVITFTAAAGLGLPTLTVDDAVLGATAVRLGPIWYLHEIGFTVAVGDDVRVLAYPCATCTVGLVAVTVDDLTTGAAIDLRAEDGRPLWLSGRGGGRGTAARGGGGSAGGNGPGAGGGPNGGCLGRGPDMSAVETLVGTVVSFTADPGTRAPLLVLAVAGEEVDVFAGPLRTWLAAGFEPSAGMELEVVVAPVELDGETHLVAITVTDPTTGLVLALRDPETGLPLTGGQGRP